MPKRFAANFNRFGRDHVAAFCTINQTVTIAMMLLVSSSCVPLLRNHCQHERCKTIKNALREKQCNNMHLHVNVNMLKTLVITIIQQFTKYNYKFYMFACVPLISQSTTTC